MIYKTLVTINLSLINGKVRLIAKLQEFENVAIEWRILGTQYTVGKLVHENLIRIRL